MRIGALANKTGLSRDTIRFYERHKLIASAPSQDPKNTYRDYPDDLVERLAMIVEAREAGLSIADLQLLIGHLEGNLGGDGSFDVDIFLDEKIAEVQRTIRQARSFLKILHTTRQSLDSLPVEWR
jgi:DNA-binding transcriptional MerR regulator